MQKDVTKNFLYILENGKMNNPQKIIECKNVFKSFSTKNGITNAVNGVNLSINKGECYGLVGESGCGKSMLSADFLNFRSC